MQNLYSFGLISSSQICWIWFIYIIRRGMIIKSSHRSHYLSFYDNLVNLSKEMKDREHSVILDHLFY